MNCNECPLNEVSEKFDKDLISKAPEDLRAFFTCSEKICEERQSKHSNSYNKYLRTSICPKTVWTVIYIGCKDSFALNQVDTVFDELVEGGYSELLCSLFENASYEIRRKLWLKMTKDHMNKMYMFDALFEREGLKPFCTHPEGEDDSIGLHRYQYYILHGSLGFINQRNQIAQD